MNAEPATDKIAKIRSLNDELRQTLIGGLAVMTPGVMALGGKIVDRLITAISTFDDFCSANDPYGEHDFGALDVDGRTVFFKIDYSDHSVVTPWIGRVEAPVLVIMGDADPDWSDPLKEAQWVASNFADVVTIMVPGAGHAPMFERPAIVNPAVSRFLIKISREKASTGHDA